MKILGISAFYHDSAAALLVDGKIVCAAQEERFTRKKHDSRFPHKAIECALREGQLTIDDIDTIIYYENPQLKFQRILSSFISSAPTGFPTFLKAIEGQLTGKLWISQLIRKELNFKKEIRFVKHHESHAASAFFASPFERAAFLTVDGVGEWETTTFGTGAGNRIKFHQHLNFPHSLGLLYAAFTYYTGFKVNSGEYKVMGLAPYGQPKYVQTILDELIDLKEDGSFRLNMSYFDFIVGEKMINERFEQLFGRSRRNPESLLTQFEMDMARSVQEVTEIVLLKIARHVRKTTQEKYLCLAGGVALNCVANGKILREGIFDDIWIQPAAGDAGGALGAVLFGWHQLFKNSRTVVKQQELPHGFYLGQQYGQADIKEFLDGNRIPYEYVDHIEEKTSELLAAGKIIGWFSGRMEFGPRALGGRSIIGDPRLPEMQKIMNLRIKYRESFRPFAPAVLEEEVSNWFEIDRPSPYMLLVAPVKNEKQRKMTKEEDELFGLDKLNRIRSEIPSVTHVDYSARIQTVSRLTNEKFHKLLTAFQKRTGCPVLINTSFNVRGEPIVCTPEDAYRCFMRTEIDYLVLENYLIDKTKQPVQEKNEAWQAEFQLD